MDDNTLYTRKESFFMTEIDDELVMMDAEQGLYFSLNYTGKFIWTLLEKPQSLEKLVQTTLDHFNLSISMDCKKDISEFINKMLQYQLITPV